MAERPILLNSNLQGTATRDVDYSFTKQFISGYTNSDVLPVTVIDDGLVEGTETVGLTLVEGKIGNFMTFTPGTNNVSLNIADNDDAPKVTLVDVPLPAYYRAGQVLHFNVRFSENVVVNTVGGIPSLPVVIGTTTVQAAYSGGTGTNTLYFNYTVKPGDHDMNGIALNPALMLNGGTIKSGSGTDALLTLNNTPLTHQCICEYDVAYGSIERYALAAQPLDDVDHFQRSSNRFYDGRSADYQCESERFEYIQ